MRGKATPSSNRGRFTARRSPATAALFGATVLLSACAQFGPELMKAGRQDYNIAVRQTDDEQTLLNLVRLRYADTPLYMDVGSVTTQFNLAQGASADLIRNEDVLRYGWRVGADIRYSETPTISYTPIQGEEFVRNVLTRLDLATFILVANSGWSIERVLRVAANRINGVGNAPTAEGPTPSAAPDYADFVRAARLLGVLQKKGVLRFRYQDPGAKARPAMYIRPDALAWQETTELFEILGIKKIKRVYDIHFLADKPNPASIGIELRSLTGIAHFLSNAIEIPARDMEAGRVTVTMNKDGQPFDWSRVSEGLFRIRSQNEPPTDASVAVKYRGVWFYIDDTDMDSKYTFQFVEQLSALLAGKIQKEAAPVLTLPVGG